MEEAKRPSGATEIKRNLKILSLMFLSGPLVYLAMVLFLLPKKQNGDPKLVYPLLICALVDMMLSKFLKDKIWNGKNKIIKTPSDFYSAFFFATIIPMALMEAVGVFGLLLYIVANNLQLSVFLIVVSFIGTIIYFPKQEEIDEKKREFSFNID